MLRRQALKVLAVRRGGAQEEGTCDNVVNLPVFQPQAAVEGQSHQFALLVADESHRFLEGIHGLNGASYRLLHGFQGVVQFCRPGRLQGWDQQYVHNHTSR